MLQRHSEAAGGAKYTEGPGHSEPAGQRSVEIKDKRLPYVPSDPLVEDLDQKSAELSRLHRSLRDSLPFPETALVLALHNRNELDVREPELIPEEPVYLQRAGGVFRIDRTEDVALHFVFLEKPGGPQDPVEGFPACPVFVTGSAFNYELLKEGRKVFLTLDNRIQFTVEQTMDRSMVKTKANSMAVIIMNPNKNGEILAMASRPTFNPNKIFKVNSHQLNNRFFSIYEPGSTFKTVIAAIALNEKLVSPEEIFHDTGSININGRFIRNWDGGKWGDLDFIHAFSNSINTVFVKVGQRLGKHMITQYVDKFGFGKKTWQSPKPQNPKTPKPLLYMYLYNCSYHIKLMVMQKYSYKAMKIQVFASFQICSAHSLSTFVFRHKQK